MHIMLVADGRSPITRRWIQGVLALGHRLTLVSTFPGPPPPGIDAYFILPVAFSGVSSNTQQRDGNGNGKSKAGALKSVVKRFRSVFLAARNLLGPLTIPGYGKKLTRIVQAEKPDLVHAMRIPFEGMLASYTPPGTPFIVTTWGNDLTLHAQSSSLMKHWTRRTLQRADGLLTDAHRDIRIAPQFGFNPERPSAYILPGGGIDITEIARLRSSEESSLPVDLPAGVPLIINPRGIRAYSNTDVFFQALPLVLERWPGTYILCPAMAGQAEAVQWVNKLKLGKRVLLLPALSQHQLWELFLRSEISVSLTTHDGTPNTLLEAMVCGCLPIVGDIEALREWITPGVNGLVVDSQQPQALAEAIVLGLENPALRQRAAEINFNLIQQRADVNLVRAQAEVFYQRVVNERRLNSAP